MERTLASGANSGPMAFVLVGFPLPAIACCSSQARPQGLHSPAYYYHYAACLTVKRRKHAKRMAEGAVLSSAPAASLTRTRANSAARLACV